MASNFNIFFNKKYEHLQVKFILIGRTKNDRILVPWDIVEAHLLLAA